MMIMWTIMTRIFTRILWTIMIYMYSSYLVTFCVLTPPCIKTSQRDSLIHWTSAITCGDTWRHVRDESVRICRLLRTKNGGSTVQPSETVVWHGLTITKMDKTASSTVMFNIPGATHQHLDHNQQQNCANVLSLCGYGLLLVSSLFSSFTFLLAPVADCCCSDGWSWWLNCGWILGPVVTEWRSLDRNGAYGDGSKPWYLVNIKIAGKWMFIPLKMVLIGIDS